MARKKQRKKSWLRMLVLFLVTPLAVWLIAFLIWFYWYDLGRLFTKDESRRVTPKRQIDKDERRERAPSPQPREKLFDEDRKKLDDILKRRN